MSDDLKKFLKKHDVQMEPPPGEWTRLKSRIEGEKKSRFFGFLPYPWTMGLATLGVAALAVLSFQNRPTPTVMRTSDPRVVLTTDEAADFLQESFADLDEETDLEEEDIFDL